jgi:hypothetical protein
MVKNVGAVVDADGTVERGGIELLSGAGIELGG